MQHPVAAHAAPALSRVAFAVALLACANAHAADLQPWTTYQGNALHSGYVPVTLDVSQFTKSWATSVGSSALNPVTEADGMVYVTDQGYFSTAGLYVVNATNGQALWNVPINDIFSVNPPAYDNGNVYFQTSNNWGDTWVWAYEAGSGKLVFQAPAASQWEHYYAPTIVDHTLYMDGGTYGGMYSFNGATGAQNWFDGNLGQYDQWTPAVDATNAYAYIGYQGLVIVDRATGTNKAVISDPLFAWSGYDMNQAPALGTQHDALAINGGRLISFDLTNKVIRWQVSDGFNSQPSVVNGTIFAIDNGALSARDEATGAQLWSWKKTGETLNGPLIVTDSHVFVAGASTTYAVDLSTHQSTWNYPAAGHLALSEGKLYIASSSSATLTAITLGTQVVGGADLQLTMKDVLVPDGSGSYAVTARVLNAGPSNATRLTLDIRVPRALGVTSIPKSCNFSAQVLHCTADSLAPGTTWRTRFGIAPTVSGHFAVSGNVTATQADPNVANNHAVATIVVQ